MTEEHKAALERGRAEGRIVREYLEGLRVTKPKRGRQRTPDSIRGQLAQIETDLVSASAIAELELVQKRRDLEAELESLDTGVDMTALEEAFVGVARSYAVRKGISYASWREVGVPAATLARSGIKRGG
jgi:hypothetical protein